MNSREVIYYNPPKTKLWGHSMERMPPSEFRTRLAAFLKEATDNVRVVTCTILIPPLIPEAVGANQQFIKELQGRLPTGALQVGQLSDVTNADFEATLELLESCKFSKWPVFLFTRAFEVEGWKFGGKSDKQSLLSENYGSRQYLGTFLFFDSIAEYREVKRLVQRTLGVELNDKHIRPRAALTRFK